MKSSLILEHLRTGSKRSYALLLDITVAEAGFVHDASGSDAAETRPAYA